ncbi:interferon regulatory factor 4-like [Paramormyrops kingsleyae]|uniref:interferon regulatory factor 4-like n=1 Tax=Paramormyrops kingsleyae TaxID=1676925 RepID=UPI003B96ECA3
MNLESDCNMSVSCGNGKLRQWLIDQIDSGKYPGLVWENDDKTIFRIPWKHAGKQDYNRDEDAALFKAWALFKGKFREGLDKPDPPTWKTRLRCALNKSNDFDELVERSQLDISDPYKVYRIIPEGAKRGAKQMSTEEPTSHMEQLGYPMPVPYAMQTQVPNYMVGPERRDWRSYVPEQHHHSDLPYGHYPSRTLSWQAPPCDNGYQITGSFYSCSPVDSQSPAFPLDPSRSAETLAFSDCRLHICLYYRKTLVKEVTTVNPQGCRISSGPEDRQGGSVEQVLFPFPYPQSQCRGTERLSVTLERGVLLWLAPDGLYGKRLCQSGIYWEGPSAPFADQPNKLEKEQTCKLFDTQRFLAELQGYVHHSRPMPKFRVLLSFGDEYPDPQKQMKMITAQVEPAFAKQLVSFTQHPDVHYAPGYELLQHGAATSEERVARHSGIQE